MRSALSERLFLRVWTKLSRLSNHPGAPARLPLGASKGIRSQPAPPGANRLLGSAYSLMVTFSSSFYCLLLGLKTTRYWVLEINLLSSMVITHRLSPLSLSGQSQ